MLPCTVRGRSRRPGRHPLRRLTTRPAAPRRRLTPTDSQNDPTMRRPGDPRWNVGRMATAEGVGLPNPVAIPAASGAPATAPKKPVRMKRLQPVRSPRDEPLPPSARCGRASTRVRRACRPGATRLCSSGQRDHGTRGAASGSTTWSRMAQSGPWPDAVKEPLSSSTLVPNTDRSDSPVTKPSHTPAGRASAPAAVPVITRCCSVAFRHSR